jgi:predicted GNAT family acetyltransferase
MTTPANTAEVRDNTADRRFETWADGELAGFTTYVLRSRSISFLHTELEPRFQGRGLGQELVAAALRSARERRSKVLPFCPYVRGFIAKHPEFLDLVPEQDRPRFDL